MFFVGVLWVPRRPLAGPRFLTHLTRADGPQIFIRVDTSVVRVAPFESHGVPPHLLGTGYRHLSRSDCTSHHFEGIARVHVTRLSTNSARALSAQQIEGVYTAMPISPVYGHGTVGDVHFDIRWVGFP